VEDVTCVECGAELLDERAQLGYDYCTRPDCQARRHRGLTITAVGVNKSADSFVVAGDDEIRARGEAGEFAKKDTNLGIGYRPVGPLPAPRRRAATGVPRAARTAPLWAHRPGVQRLGQPVGGYRGTGCVRDSVYNPGPSAVREVYTA